MEARRIMKTTFQVAVLCVFCSCTDNDCITDEREDLLTLTPEEYMSVAYDTPKEISEKQALDFVAGFDSNSNTRAASLKPSVTKKLYWETSVESAENKNTRMPVYEIALGNGDDGGFALVSADERNPCVIAYSLKGELSDSVENAGMAMMLQESKSALYKDFLRLNHIRDTYREKTLSKLRKYFGVEDIRFEDIQDKITVSNVQSRSGKVYPTGELIDSIDNRIFVTWQQGAPYNDLLDLPKDPYSKYSRNQLGCVATAVAQILSYYETPNTVYGCQLNWKLLKESRTVSTVSSADKKNQVANLCKHVAYGIGTVWNNAGDGSSNMKNAYSYLNSLGIIFDAGKNYGGYGMDAALIVASLREYQPVLISGFASVTRSNGTGGGHCWILDGFQMRRQSTATTTRSTIKSYDTYIHANFGWAGICDGYYLVDRGTTNLVFETSEMTFNSDVRLYPYVRRK